MIGRDVLLPVGFDADGTREQAARVRPLSGRDEELLAEQRALPAAHRVTALLARSVERLGPHAPVEVEHVRALTAGDREALVLHLRRLTVGERLDCLLACPHPDCGRSMDLTLSVADLLAPPADTWAPVREARIEAPGGAFRVRFRLPTGADEEAAAVAALTDVESAARLLIGRCVVSVLTEAGCAVPEPPAEVVAALPDLITALDPQAEITLDLHCPHCGGSFVTWFDPADYLFRELAGSDAAMYQEVHVLASHYHWSEAEILALPVSRRRRYLSLIRADVTPGEPE